MPAQRGKLLVVCATRVILPWRPWQPLEHGTARYRVEAFKFIVGAVSELMPIRRPSGIIGTKAAGTDVTSSPGDEFRPGDARLTFRSQFRL